VAIKLVHGYWLEERKVSYLNLSMEVGQEIHLYEISTRRYLTTLAIFYITRPKLVSPHAIFMLMEYVTRLDKN
jgi:hypothetical protein